MTHRDTLQYRASCGATVMIRRQVEHAFNHVGANGVEECTAMVNWPATATVMSDPPARFARKDRVVAKPNRPCVIAIWVLTEIFCIIELGMSPLN